MSDLDRLADRYVDDFAALDPCTAADMGIAGQESRLTDFGPDGFAARADLARRTLASLQVTPLQGAGDRVAAAVLRERLEVDLELDAAGIPDADLATIGGPLQKLLHAIELVDRGAGSPGEALTGRVAALAGTLAGLRQSLTRAAADGRVAARRQVAANVRQCAQLTAYLEEFPARYEDAALAGAVRAAGQALGDFADYLGKELLPVAPHRDGLGVDRYTLEVRNHLGTRLDLEDTYAWGWAELARIEAEMAATAEKILPGQPVAAVVAALDADPAHQITGADRFRDWLQELADQAIGALDGVHFDIPAPLRQVECRIPSAPSGVSYLAPAEDLSRPGTVWWTLPPGAVEAADPIPTWTVPATMFHEGVPGHHLQLGATTLNTATLNRFQRVSSELHPGHCEGWGLYAERLMAELGFYPDPAHYFGMLAGGQQLRAARVVLDIGMHLELPIPAGTGFHEGQRWTRDLGREFLRAHSPDDDSVIDFEIDRYLGRPAQALAYKVGERVWMQAREAARQAAGDAFDLKAFHRRALNLGPMGLDLLAAELTAAPR